MKAQRENILLAGGLPATRGSIRDCLQRVKTETITLKQKSLNAI